MADPRVRLVISAHAPDHGVFGDFAAAFRAPITDLDPEDGYFPREALCPVCNLTFNRALSECPECKDLR